jgi:hypothetical protein
MKIVFGLLFAFVLACCQKSVSNPSTPLGELQLINTTIDNKSTNFKAVSTSPTIRLSYNEPINRNSLSDGIRFQRWDGKLEDSDIVLTNGDSTLEIKPKTILFHFSKYYIVITQELKSTKNQKLTTNQGVEFQTELDSKDKFPRVSEDSLITIIQKTTFKYFWDFGHPTSGLIRERNQNTDVCTIGGTGFGIMAILVGIENDFVQKQDAILRIQKMITFLKTKATTYHGAFPHWLNGNTGTTVPFSQFDDGGDLVETSYLVMGLIAAKEYFSSNDTKEVKLRNEIQTIIDAIEWSWYTKNGEDQLYWHWSDNFGWKMNHQIKGWNECLVTYVLAAASKTYPIQKSVYTKGWTSNGGFRNGKSFYNTILPLGEDLGGPLFFSHYSFLGIDPRGLQDNYANYETQVINHSKVNYLYCVANPKNYFGYSSACWGLTASDNFNGYSAHSPTNDLGVISPTAAISSYPFTPLESKAALEYFYYTLGDKLLGQYGFYDSFSLDRNWFANSFLAIDQGPMIIMLENHRSKLLWKLFTKNPEVKSGMLKLGFNAPYL